MVIGTRQLATGNWQLATGDWRLATGNWELALFIENLTDEVSTHNPDSGFRIPEYLQPRTVGLELVWKFDS